MSKKMLINATHLEENRVAIVEDGILTELDIEIAGKEQTKGNIYKAAVVRVESGLQAAFVDYGGDRLGFLQMGELHPSLFRNKENNKGRPRINDVLQRGQELLVQIVKEERGTKGAALTTYLSLPGRYMVLMPDSDTKGVSRKIDDEGQRRTLKATMASLDLPNSFGYIVRTAAIGQSKEELKRDFTYLQRLYESIESLEKRINPPALVYKESNLIIRSIRDYFSTDMDEVLVDDPKVYQEARDFFQQVMPEYAKLVKLHQERRPIFARYQIEEQIETISKSKVPLPSGGSIVIDSTEALVAVDVNSGKLAGEQGVEATAYRTNLEAAAEVGRQLRLRDLGGLIVIDFIDMRERKHDRDVEKRLKQALKNDKARVTVGRISQFGLLEMSRQRIKAALAEGAYLSCPHCNGSGKVKSVEAQAVAFLRKLQGGIAKGQIGIVEGEIPLDVATYLLNTRREELHEMERLRDIEIFIKGRPDFVAGQSELSFQRRSAEKEKREGEVVEAGALPEPPETEPAPQAEPASTPEAAEPPPSGEEGNGKRKRRRRRRRKPAAAKMEAEQAEKPTEGGAEIPAEAPAAAAEEPEKQKEPVTEGPTPEAEGEKKAAEETAPESEVAKKPSRSRGRRRKKPEAETAVTEVVEQKPPSEETAEKAAEPQQEAQAKAAVPEAADTQAADAGKKPSRARGRRRKTPQTETKAASDPAAQEKAVSEEKTAEPAAAASEERKPSRSRARRPKRSEAEAAVSPEAAGQAKPAPEEKPAAAGETSDTAESEKPRGRARRKKADAATTTSSTKEGAEERTPAAEGDTAKAEEKPKRRTRKKTAGTAPEGSKEEAGSSPAAEEANTKPAGAEAEPKPARRTRAKKPAAEKAAAAGEKATSASAEGDEPEKPKTRSGRKTAVKGKGSAEAPPASDKEAPKPAAKKAAPRKTAARTKTADKETSGKAEEKDQTRKATAKPRAPRKKAATAKTPEAVEEKTES